MADTEERKRAKAEAFKRWRGRNPDGAKKWARSHPEAILWRSILPNAKARGKAMELTREQFDRLLEPMVCSVTGIELDWSNKSFRPSIDRIDNSRGYHLDNVRLTCWAFNRARADGTDEDFARLARAYVERHGP